MRVRLISLNDFPDIELQGILSIVGRHRTCDVWISSERVSRRHCCLAIDHDRLIVRDLGSSNGTFINDIRVEAGILRQGEILTISSFRYRLDVDDEISPGQEQEPPSDLALSFLPTNFEAEHLNDHDLATPNGLRS